MELTTLVKSLSGLEANQWHEALGDEFASFMKNKTWILMDLLANRSTISSKKVFRKKYNATRTIEKYKAQMVVGSKFYKWKV
jgi:hypothetical protein